MEHDGRFSAGAAGVVCHPDSWADTKPVCFEAHIPTIGWFWEQCEQPNLGVSDHHETRWRIGTSSLSNSNSNSNSNSHSNNTSNGSSHHMPIAC